jgi:hypothetical protein
MDTDKVLGSNLNEAEAFTKLLEACKICESSAKQLALLRNQAKWLEVQELFERVRAICTGMATQGVSQAVNLPDLRRSVTKGVH